MEVIASWVVPIWAAQQPNATERSNQISYGSTSTARSPADAERWGRVDIGSELHRAAPNEQTGGGDPSIQL